MHIVVCVKQVPNPEASFSMLKVDEQAKQVVPVAGLQLVMSPFDEQALEAALRVRDAGVETKITALCVGPESARNTLKHALAMGADEAVLVKDDGLPDGAGEATAYVLARAVRQLPAADLVLTGRQAADWDAGIVGCGIAELLGLPVVTLARRVDIVDGLARVERVLPDGFETIEATLPAVVTVSNELGAARKPSLRETMRAARKPLAVRALPEAGIEPQALQAIAARRTRERLYVPVKDTRCEVVEGVDDAAQAAALVQRLRDARLV
ncbi:MAG TPA: electron transfer flavoprotein subunit beta/FixA family protein [Burkholderiales bacterium]|nr:electron transfer flavoprotein subunit beta/FixA family protein [Burkholderiales bacterium]